MKYRAISILFLTVIGVGALIFLGPRSSMASEGSDISVSFSSEYQVNTQNSAEIKILAKFRNTGDLTSVLTSYDLNIGVMKPVEVTAKIGETSLQYEVKETQGFVIRVNMAETALRAGEEKILVVTYKMEEFMRQVGGGFDVALPIFNLTEGTSADYVKLIFPGSFGVINYSNSEYSASEDRGFVVATFGELSDVDHIYISIGNERYFSYDVEKELNNEDEVFVKQDVVIAPDLGNQRVVLLNVSPSPDSARIADDGNYVLSYNIPPKKTLWVRIHGFIIGGISDESAHVLPSAERETYLETSNALFRIDDGDILDELSLIEENTSVSEKVSWIYTYILDNLNLSEDFRNLHSFEHRKGAQVALKTYKNASAEDFADTFVALARTSGVPARLVSGYIFPYAATSQNFGMYHVWPQYWDESAGWVSADPAYEAYTEYPQRESVGLNRVVLLVCPDNHPDVKFSETSQEVFLTNEIVEASSKMDVRLDVPNDFQAGVYQAAKLEVTNAGNVIIRDIQFSDIFTDLEVRSGYELEEEIILPGETSSFDFDLRVNSWSISGHKDLRLSVVGETFLGSLRHDIEESISIRPLWWVEPVSWIITSVLFIVATIIMLFVFNLARRLVLNIMSHKR